EVVGRIGQAEADERLVLHPLLGGELDLLEKRLGLVELVARQRVVGATERLLRREHLDRSLRLLLRRAGGPRERHRGGEGGGEPPPVHAPPPSTARRWIAAGSRIGFPSRPQQACTVNPDASSSPPPARRIA